MRPSLSSTSKQKRKWILTARRQTSLLYYCHDCQSPYMQPLGRKHTKTNEKNGSVNHSYQIPSGPPPGITERCGECGGKYHVRSLLGSVNGERR